MGGSVCFGLLQGLSSLIETMEDQQLSLGREKAQKRLQITCMEPERDVELSNEAKDARHHLQNPVEQKLKAMDREKASLEDLKENLVHLGNILQEQNELEGQAREHIKSLQQRDEAVLMRKKVAFAQKGEFEKVSDDALGQLRSKETQMMSKANAQSGEELCQHYELQTKRFGLSLACAGQGAIRFTFMVK